MIALHCRIGQVEFPQVAIGFPALSFSIRPTYAYRRTSVPGLKGIPTGRRKSASVFGGNNTSGEFSTSKSVEGLRHVLNCNCGESGSGFLQLET